MGNAIVRYKGMPKGNSWARWMVARTGRLSQNNLCSIIGKTGSGKTFAGMAIGEIIAGLNGVPFKVDNIVFNLPDLMKLINSDKVKKGSVIVCDEFQTSISARDFQAESNKVFNYLMTTFRHRNLTLLFCTPFESLLDKTTRKLFHVRMETMSIDRNKNTCKLKPRYIEYADYKTEPYRKQMIIFFKDKDGNNRQHKLFFWDVPKPSEELIKAYEIKKRVFTDNLNRNIEMRLAKYDESGKNITAEIKVERKDLTTKQRRAMEVIANNDYETACKILGISKATIHQHKKAAQKKGYFLKEFIKK